MTGGDDEPLFMNVQEAYRTLEGSSDDELLRMLFAYDADDESLEPGGDITSASMVTFMLRERGYEIEGEWGDVEITDPDGNRVLPDDV